jgi:TP901 family phage tail tape measure protein
MSETVDILVRGKDGASAAFNSARSSLTSLGNTAGTATVSLGNLGKSIGTVGLAAAGLAAAGVAAATAAVGAFGVSAVNVAGNFEQAMANVGAISGATDDELAALTQTARDLGASTSFSATEAAEGMQFLAMAGFDVADSIAAMPGLLGLAAATQMDLGRAADITSNIMSGFGIAAEESGRVADILAYTASNANTDVLQLGEAMKYAAPVAASLGISIEDTATAIAVMADSGIQGSMAGTAIRGAFLRLASPAKDATKLMEDLGIKVFDAQGSMLPLPEVIANMNRGMGNMSDQQRAAALQTLVGTEAMGGFLALLNAGPEALAEFSGAVAESGGTAQTMAEKQLATYQGRLKLLSSAFESLQITVGTAMLPALTKGVELLTSGVGVVDQWAQSLMESGVLGQMWAQVLAFAAPIIERLSAGLSTLGAFVMGTVVPAVHLASVYRGDGRNTAADYRGGGADHRDAD